MSKSINKILQLCRQNIGFILLLLAMFASRSSLADWYLVPTGSMQPTIVEGDRILVNKIAYHLELPFTDVRLLDIAEPQRGDIVVIHSAAADTRLVKRVIGLPGDQIAMQDNRLMINGQAIQYVMHEDGLHEQLPEQSHRLQLLAVAKAMDNFAPVEVPNGYYLVLGDNRNNSADSRVWGFIPEREIQGKAFKVLVSLNPDNYYLPRTERTLLPLI